MSIATSKPSRSTKKSRVSAGRSDLMFGTALLIVTRPEFYRRPAEAAALSARSTRLDEHPPHQGRRPPCEPDGGQRSSRRAQQSVAVHKQGGVLQPRHSESDRR